MDNHALEAAIESILFASGEPFTVDRLALLVDADGELTRQAALNLAGRYNAEMRGVRVAELDNAFQMVTAPEQADFVRRALEERKSQLLSKGALEVLSLVAYYQPITRAEIDRARGVDSSYTVSSMADKGFIEEAGRLEVPGRPVLFRTTQAFLRCFGLKSLEELPELGELEGQLLMTGRAEGGEQ